MNVARIAPAIAALTMVVSPARADFVGPVLEITAESALGSGSYIVQFDPAFYDPVSATYDWALSDDVEILDEHSGAVIAIVKGRSGGTGVFFVEDPQVSLQFDVQSGAVNTLFTITSAMLSFPTIADAEGTASAGLLATDLNGDGVTLTGSHGDGVGAYLAHYNGLVPGGTTFAESLSGVSTDIPFDTAAASASTGPFAPIGDPVDDMSTQFDFSLSAFDAAAGTSTFVIVPGPAGLGVLAVGLVMARRRRRT